jgi:hypothetical protein
MPGKGGTGAIPNYERATGTLPLRTGYTPPYSAHVLRGGMLLSSDLEKQARVCLKVHGTLGVSVFIGEVQSVEDLIAQAAPTVAKMPRLSVCSFAVLRKWHVVATFNAPHYTILLPDLGEGTFEALRDCFLAIPNPYTQ